jgi:hypothetical protein
MYGQKSRSHWARFNFSVRDLYGQTPRAEAQRFNFSVTALPTDQALKQLSLG